MSAGSAAPMPPSTSTSISPAAATTPSAAHAINYIGVTFRTRTIEEIRAIFDEVRKDIWPAVESRKLQLPIDKVFPFAEIGNAFAHMEANKHLGKIVVTL